MKPSGSAIGWRGAWVGGENLAFDPHVNPRRKKRRAERPRASCLWIEASKGNC